MVHFIEREKVNRVEKRNLCSFQTERYSSTIPRPDRGTREGTLNLNWPCSVKHYKPCVGIEVAILPHLQSLIIMFGPPFCDRKMSSTV